MCLNIYNINGESLRFLSKAHIDQTITVSDNSLEISQIETRIDRQEKRVADAELVISQLDSQVQTLIDYDRIRVIQCYCYKRKSERRTCRTKQCY